MRRLLLIALLALASCGYPGQPVHSTSARSALSNAPELLEFEPVTTRQDLFREMARTSSLEAGRAATQPVLFPISLGSDVIAAPGLDPRADLLQPLDGGRALLSFDGPGDEAWPVDRKDSLQGLSEREAVELIARSLLSQWGINSAASIEIDRAPGAPYAVAYANGILRVNPSFVYVAASLGIASAPQAAQ